MVILGSLITTTNNLLSYAYHAYQAELTSAGYGASANAP
jgi:hypothetical protein